MGQKLTIAATIAFFLASSGVLLSRHSRLQTFSPQHTVDPDTLAEEINPADNIAFFDNEPVPIPRSVDALLARVPLSDTRILGEQAGEKRIEVDLTNQRLYAFEGDRKVYDFLVSTGRNNWTPTGVFDIWIKVRAQKMSGGSKELGTYYYLPNVPYIMFFYNDQYPKWKGYSTHGTYWHNNFGTPMSHGCINLSIPDAEKLYYWAQPHLNGASSIHASADNPGTKVIIYGTAPRG